MPMAALPAETAGCAAASLAPAGFVEGVTVLLPQVRHCATAPAWPRCTCVFTCCHRLSCPAIWHSAAYGALTLLGLHHACNRSFGAAPHTHMSSAACAGCQQGAEGPQGADEAARTAAAGRQCAAVQQQQGMRTASLVGLLPDWLWWRLLAGIKQGILIPAIHCQIPDVFKKETWQVERKHLME